MKIREVPSKRAVIFFLVLVMNMVYFCIPCTCKFLLKPREFLGEEYI